MSAKGAHREHEHQRRRPEDAAPASLEEDYGGNKRSLRKWEARLLATLAIGFTVFHMIVLNFYPLEPLLFARFTSAGAR